MARWDTPSAAARFLNAESQEPNPAAPFPHSRATAGVRRHSLIVNLPGKPSAVRECLEILAPAIREGIAHLRGEDPHAPSEQPPVADTR